MCRMKHMYTFRYMIAFVSHESVRIIAIYSLTIWYAQMTRIALMGTIDLYWCPKEYLCIYFCHLICFCVFFVFMFCVYVLSVGETDLLTSYANKTLESWILNLFVITIYMVCHHNDLWCNKFHDMVMEYVMLLEIGFTMAVILPICCHIRANVYIISARAPVLCILIKRKGVYKTNLVIGLNTNALHQSILRLLHIVEVYTLFLCWFVYFLLMHLID